MVFGRSFCDKRQIWVSERHFVEVRGDARSWLMARSKVHGRLSIRVNCTFSLSITVPESGVMRRDVYSSAVFVGGSTSLHSNFIRTGSSLINHCWRQKTRDTGLPEGKDRIILCSLVLAQYWSVTDRQTDGYFEHIHYTALA